MPPARIQRRRTRGSRMPAGAIYVGRGSKWGNPFKLGETLIRIPGLDGSAWEHEDQPSKTAGDTYSFRHSSGRTTWHRVEYANREQVVELHRRIVQGQSSNLTVTYPSVDEIRAELAGRDLACWCPLTDTAGRHVSCHADTLLHTANPASIKLTKHHA